MKNLNLSALLRKRRANLVRAMIVSGCVSITGCGMHPLNGTVVGDNGEPLSACSVTLEIGTNGGMQKTKATDVDGNFDFGSLTTFGGCAVRFEKLGYDTQKVACSSDGKPLRIVLRKGT